ncbi:hypothetical protein [Streptomyces sp. NPDC055099]
MEHQTGTGPRLEQVCDTAGFVALMKEIKGAAGLSYRQLEERAAGQGDFLPRSTLSDVFARNALPRPELLAAFVRACGDGERLEQWLEVRDRIASAPAVCEPEVTLAARGDARDRTRFTSAIRHPAFAKRGALVVLGVAVAGVALVAFPVPQEPEDTRRAEPSQAAVPHGVVRIRPMQAPDLCLTDGFLPKERYPSQVAVHRPCAQAEPPTTELIPADGGLYRVRWDHPVHGEGCLTVLRGGPAEGLLEPRQQCAGTTRFDVRVASGEGNPSEDGADTPTAYVLRLDGDQCVGIDRTGSAGSLKNAAAVVQRCEDRKSQQYLIAPKRP